MTPEQFQNDSKERQNDLRNDLTTIPKGPQNNSRTLPCQPQKTLEEADNTSEQPPENDPEPQSNPRTITEKLRLSLSACTSRRFSEGTPKHRKCIFWGAEMGTKINAQNYASGRYLHCLADLQHILCYIFKTTSSSSRKSAHTLSFKLNSAWRFLICPFKNSCLPRDVEHSLDLQTISYQCGWR